MSVLYALAEPLCYQSSTLPIIEQGNFDVDSDDMPF